MLIRKDTRLFFILVFVMVFFSTGYSQVPVLMRYTLGTGAAPKAVSGDGNRKYVPQSIGQMSVIGAFKTEIFQVRQGFIQPVKRYGTNIKDVDLKADVYPNPFQNNIFVLFGEENSDRIFVNLYNLNGGVVYTDEFASSQMITLTPGKIPSGFFLLKITMNKRKYTCKVLKK
jgi:hypothetical protein